MKPDVFRQQLRVFTSTNDPLEQENAIVSMLDPLDLDIEYKKLASEGGMRRVLEIFTSFTDTADDELINEYDKKSLEQVGQLSTEYLAKGAYAAFAQMVFSLTAESLTEYYPDLTPGSTHFYRYIPDEIYLQTFLLDTMANVSSFDWERDIKIVEQSLMVMTVCFSDIYSFLTEEDEDEEIAD
jgi:hypothetical protein